MNTQWVGSQPPDFEGDPSEAPRLLLVDDADIERTALATLLRRRDFEVDEAADGSAAIQMVAALRYDLVLLDLQMPRVDGFDVLAYVQSKHPDLPVILLSGLPPDEIGDGLLRLPNAELPPLLQKPVDPRRLVQIIDLKLAGNLP